MSKIRRAARGEPCLLRVPGVCSHDPETTVLAHVRRGGNAGVGMKPPDVSAVFSCAPCHDVLDGRNPKVIVGPELILEAMLRTHDRLRQMGLVA